MVRTYGAITLDGDLTPIARRWASMDRILRRDLLSALKASGEYMTYGMRSRLRRVVQSRTGKTEEDLGYKLLTTANGLGLRVGPVRKSRKMSRAHIARWIEYGFRHVGTSRDATTGRIRSLGRIKKGHGFATVPEKPFLRPTFEREVPRAERAIRLALEKVAAKL